MTIYEVGKPIPKMIGLNDNVYFSMTDGGAIVTVLMRDPTQKEIDAFQQNQPLRMGIFKRRGQMILLFKFGALQWMDAPFSPHIGPEFALPKEIPDGSSLSMQIMLVDPRDGVVKSLRLVSPPTRFARALVSSIREQQIAPFDLNVYYTDLQQLMGRYSTNLMVDEAAYSCKLGGA